MYIYILQNSFNLIIQLSANLQLCGNGCNNDAKNIAIYNYYLTSTSDLLQPSTAIANQLPDQLASTKIRNTCTRIKFTMALAIVDSAQIKIIQIAVTVCITCLAMQSKCKIAR